MVIMNGMNLNTQCTVHCSGDDGDVQDKNDNQSNDDDNN